MILLIQIPPPVFTVLRVFEGCITWSENNIKQFHSYLWFLIINIFLVTTISGSIVEVVSDFLGTTGAVGALALTCGGVMDHSS